MSIKVVLFDLDGSLLPMDQDIFIKTYFGMLVKKIAPCGYSPELLVDTIWKGTVDMVKNDGGKTNEECFWDRFVSVFGEASLKDMSLFDEFYEKDFDKVKDSCGFDPMAAVAVAEIKKMGYRVALATQPAFPMAATERRIKWAGLSKDDFELVTTYENSRFCKPSLDYYRDIVEVLGVSPEECLMVGNDVSEDMITEKLGMKVFLLPACLINKNDEDIDKYPHGNLSDLVEFVKSI